MRQDQLLKGNKPEIVARCVDRYFFGNMPRCPTCGGGKLE